MSATASELGRRSGQRLLVVLQGLVPLAGRLVGAVRLLVIACAVAAGVIVVVPLTHGLPSLPVGVALLVVAGVLALPPIVLWLFLDALREVLALPAWLRSSPDVLRDHGNELAGLVSAARAPVERAHVARDSWRAGRLLLQAHAEVPGYGAVLRLVSVPFLIVVAAAFVGALAEIVLAPTVVVVDLLLRVL